MAKQRVHELILKVRFNRPVSRDAAKRAVRSSNGQEMLATIFEEETQGWGKAKVVAVK